jgi:YegS/Rv2252/BmrU family lipid kinase
MRHIFLLNPVAGNGKASTDVLPKIITAVKSKGVEYEIHRTVNVGDARRYVKKRCDVSGGEPLRFYAVGGDGTMNEVLNGMYDYDNAELAVVPAGTGNDLIRTFGAKEDFLDIEKQIDGEARKIDVMRYGMMDMNGQPISLEAEGGPVSDMYALNMVNFGFDAEVVSRITHIKNSPFVGGAAAYLSGVFITLVGKHPLKLRVEIDGKTVADGAYLFAAACNGRFSGGGFDGMPCAVIDDGMLDVLLVGDMTRRFFISMLGKYRSGTYMDDPRMDGHGWHYTAKEAVFTPLEEMYTAIDGEPVRTGAVRMGIVPAAVNFAVPAKG